MRRLIVVPICWVLLFCGAASFAQQDQTEASRKVVRRVDPLYPALARTMKVSGNVRLDVLVAGNGTVRSVEITGGHPVLAQAAMGAIEKWKWEPAGHETHETVEVKFNPR